MTRQELIENINRHTKRATRWSIALLISWFAVLGLLVVVTKGVSPAAETVVGGVFVAFMLGTVFALMLGALWSMRRSGLACPHCRALLTKDLWPVAVATGRCGRCGKPIVDSDP